MASRGSDFEVTLLSEAAWSPDLGGTEFEFCCPSCEARFEEKYEQLQQGVD